MGNAKSTPRQKESYFIFEAKGGILQLARIEPHLFELDLILIESFLPQILAAMLMKAYKDGVYKFTELLNWLEVSNPLNFDQSLGHKFYEYKLKRLLMNFTEVRSSYDDKCQANYLLESADLVLSNMTSTPITGDLSITLEIKIDFD